MKSAKPLSLRDSVIDKLETNFIDETGKTHEQIRYFFPDCKGRTCQGLVLFHKRKTGRKKLVLDYWLKNKSKRYVIGYYHRKNFNVKHIEKKIADLRAEYGSGADLTWTQDIKIGEDLKKRNKYDEQLGQIQLATFNDAIKNFIESGCPQIDKPSESLHRTTIRECCRYLIGYDDRINALEFVADENNRGKIEFRDSYKYDGVVQDGINSWEEFWRKYPPKEYDDIGWGKSIYDTPMGFKVLSTLTDHDVRHYLNTLTNSPGTKKQIKEVFSYVWANALQKSMLGKKVPPNPVSEIKIEKPTKSVFSKYDTKEFTDEELGKIYTSCDKFRGQFPFQTQVIKLLMISGRRRETLLRLKWSNIQWEEKSHLTEEKNYVKTYGVVNIPAEINKTKNPDSFFITTEIKRILDDLHLQREQFHWSMFIDWCFPSPRIKDKQFLRKGNENNSDKARLKDVRDLWEKIKADCALTDVAMRMFRNTRENKVNELKKTRSTWDVISVTGRTDTRSAESSYLNKKLNSKTADLSNDVDERYSKIIKLVKK